VEILLQVAQDIWIIKGKKGGKFPKESGKSLKNSKPAGKGEGIRRGNIKIPAK